MNANVKRGRAYEGLDAWAVENPNSQRFVPGRAVGIAPAHEEAPGWRAILAGYTEDGSVIVVPLQGHFGKLRARKCVFEGPGSGSLYLSRDEPSPRDEVDFVEAKYLALSIAHTFGLEGRD